MTDVSGWGGTRGSKHESCSPCSTRRPRRARAARRPLIARGLGRSYGDSAIAPEVVDAGARSNLIAFDEESGVLECDAGVSLDEILRVFVPRGWFLPVTPGTRHVTVGGAIASDVHGKNHHSEGTFGEHVLSMRILLGDGSIVVASPTEHPELFHATCGGMGLTGIVLTAEFRLKPIASSLIDETTIKAPDLDSVLAAFEQTKDSTYSVAWIDCLAKGRSLGRSLLTVGEHAASGPLQARSSGAPRIPIDFPGIAMNRLTMGAFNTAYYQRVRHARHSRRIPYEPFLYPLEILRDWNRMYGSTGFLQYQFVLPFDAGVDGLRDILERIACLGTGVLPRRSQGVRRAERQPAVLPDGRLHTGPRLPSGPGGVRAVRRPRPTRAGSRRSALPDEGCADVGVHVQGDVPAVGRVRGRQEPVPRGRSVRVVQSQRLGLA